MAYLSDDELRRLNFKSLGSNVKISRDARIYEPEKMSIGSNVRIDDFCVLSGLLGIGNNVHIAVFCNVAGGEKGVFLEDFSGLAYGCQVFSQSDDYSGRTLTNPTIPDRFKREIKKTIHIKRHSIVGAGSLIFPGVTLEEGTAVGALSVVTKTTEAWSIYHGNPAKKIKNRKRDLLLLEQAYLGESND